MPGATNVPRPGAVSSQPSAVSSERAASTVLRWTCSVVARRRLPGKGSPGRNRPRRISAAKARAICRNGGSAASRETAMAKFHGARGMGGVLTGPTEIGNAVLALGPASGIRYRMESGDRQIRGACALDCPDTCSWIVTVKGGEPVALRGDPEHPYTRGSLCNKVADYLNYTRSPDRLLHPLKRVGPKGTGQFTRISWAEALDTIAARLRDAIDEHGGEAIWPCAGTGNMGL